MTFLVFYIFKSKINLCDNSTFYVFLCNGIEITTAFFTQKCDKFRLDHVGVVVVYSTAAFLTHRMSVLSCCR